MIGANRFAPFLDACGADPAKAIRLYSWNIEVAGSLLGGFHALEVAIRNSMHRKLVSEFGNDEWWNTFNLHASDMREVDTAMDKLDRLKPGAWTPGHVVAELSLGFWTSLLVNRYHSSLWEKKLEYAFPNYTGRRGDLHRILERLRKLRNRVAHHEPVFARDLMYDHESMVEVAEYVSGDVGKWIESHSRLPIIVQARSDTLAGTRLTAF